MLNAHAWLTEQVELPGQFGYGQRVAPRHERIAELVVANGGFEVHGWGILSYGGGHRRGLEQEEALSLMQYAAFMEGATAAGVDLFEAFRPYFDEYVRRVEAAELTAQQTGGE